MTLVPVSIEKNLSSKEEIVLLGDWCINNYTSALSKKNIPAYHWTDKNKLNKDFKYIDDLYEKLLPIYANAMNSYHNTTHSNMFWRIVCGNWLRGLITVTFDRWCMAELAIKTNEINDIMLLDIDSYLIPKNFEDFRKLAISDEWNSQIFYKIFTKLTDIKIHKLQTIKPKIFTSKLSVLKKTIKVISNKILSKLLFPLSKKNKVIFVDSYLPIKEQWKIENKLKQFPSFFKFNETITRNPINFIKREELKIEYHPKSDFESVLISLIPEQAPSSYLEDYEKIILKFNHFPSYKSVKAIYTANAQFFNDQFNIWSAHAKEAGSKLITGQHGGGTRTLKNDTTLDHDYAICDYYITWGNGGAFNKKNVVLPVNKFSEYTYKFNIKKNGLLHVLNCDSRYIIAIYSNHMLSKYKNYINNQKLFINLIEKKIDKGYKLRKNPNHINQRWHKDFDFNKNIDIDYEKHFIKSIKNNKLVVVTSNHTTFLQSLSMNIPTVAYWDNKHEILENSVVDDYEKLCDIGILFNSPEEAAKHVNDNWDTIDIWWNSPELQSIRKEFCNKFIYTSNKKDRVLQWSVFFNQFI